MNEVHARDGTVWLCSLIYTALFSGSATAWWLKRQMGENHRDSAQMPLPGRENTTGISYERTLLSSAANICNLHCEVNFSLHSLKRIQIIYKRNLPLRLGTYKYALILPVIVLFLYSFNTVIRRNM
jgi:hypothetical protein